MAPAVGATPYAARRRRPRWVWVAFALLLVVPTVEIAAIIAVGKVIGAWPTVLLLLAESLLGAWLVKREGRRAWGALNDALHTGRMPSRQLADAALVLVGGTLLLAPGFVSDVVGFLLILPFTRPLARRLLERVVAGRVLGIPVPSTGGASASSPGATGPAGSAAPRPRRADVVEGEIVRDDPTP